ncbi:hypothetical protein HII31_07144 [Pseudocercospora fuligena]|uniref:Uncharacterized protein n=1 Tax=Pseudocercospora fuligena TaxID=685502 RepID=A0A8H6RIU9_9PEZI|nr:hypothetical protein HII31_07144 [Pseudocercospora fuligena]
MASTKSTTSDGPVDWKAALVKDLNDKWADSKQGIILPMPSMGTAEYCVSTSAKPSPEQITKYVKEGTLPSAATGKDPTPRCVVLWIFDVSEGTDADPLPEIQVYGLSGLDNELIEGACYFKTREGIADYLIPKEKLRTETRGHGKVTFSVRYPYRLESFKLEGDLHKHLAGHRDKRWEDKLEERRL